MTRRGSEILQPGVELADIIDCEKQKNVETDGQQVAESHRTAKYLDANDADRIRKWLKRADEALKVDGLRYISEVRWKVLTNLNQEDNTVQW